MYGRAHSHFIAEVVAALCDVDVCSSGLNWEQRSWHRECQKCRTVWCAVVLDQALWPVRILTLCTQLTAHSSSQLTFELSAHSHSSPSWYSCGLSSAWLKRKSILHFAGALQLIGTLEVLMANYKTHILRSYKDDWLKSSSLTEFHAWNSPLI